MPVSIDPEPYRDDMYMLCKAVLIRAEWLGQQAENGGAGRKSSRTKKQFKVDEKRNELSDCGQIVKMPSAPALLPPQ